MNRQVCVDCKKAQCTVCHIEVSPDPEYGCFHFSPDMGSLLRFMPDYCPLYSSTVKVVSNQLIVHDCRICTSIKKDYPEYEIFGETKVDYRFVDRSFTSKKIEVYVYTCNLCGSCFDYVCEYDLHMRSHTKYGKNIAIIGIRSIYEVSKSVNSRLDGDEFESLEEELMKITGVSSVSALFSKSQLE